MLHILIHFAYLNFRFKNTACCRGHRGRKSGDWADGVETTVWGEGIFQLELFPQSSIAVSRVAPGAQPPWSHLRKDLLHDLAKVGGGQLLQPIMVAVFPANITFTIDWLNELHHLWWVKHRALVSFNGLTDNRHRPRASVGKPGGPPPGESWSMWWSAESRACSPMGSKALKAGK